MERNQPSILSGGSRLDTTLTVPAGRGTEVQQRMGQTGGKEKSRRKESGSPRKGIKGKKRGLNRELITLGGKKKQETSIRRTLKRKMNQLRGKAGIPAIRKENVITPLQESPISVLFIDNTKGGKLAKIF